RTSSFAASSTGTVVAAATGDGAGAGICADTVGISATGGAPAVRGSGRGTATTFRSSSLRNRALAARRKSTSTPRTAVASLCMDTPHAVRRMGGPTGALRNFLIYSLLSYNWVHASATEKAHPA